MYKQIEMLNYVQSEIAQFNASLQNVSCVGAVSKQFGAWQLKLRCIMNCNSQSAVKVSLPVAFCISAMRVQAQYNPDLYYTQCKL